MCSFAGAIGDDHFGSLLKNQCQEMGINPLFMKDPNNKTGHCFVLVNTGNTNRSLCTYLGAASNLTVSIVTNNQGTVSEGFETFYCLFLVSRKNISYPIGRWPRKREFSMPLVT